ncbi:hypothetical protein LCGC14_2051330, partial [marine sediment metagenome]
VLEMPKNKDKNIKISREDHEKMRKSAGFKYKFTITESKPYDHYEFLKTLSKLKRGGEKKNDRKKS